MDWGAHSTHIFAALGEDAVLTAACGDPPVTLRVIDATSGLAVGFNSVDVQTIGPSAYVMASQLSDNHIALADIHDGLLTLKGKDWRIVSHEERPGIGEVQLILEKA